MARKCLFCDGPANSKEHAFPEWLTDVSPGRGKMTHSRSSDLSGAWQTNGYDTQVRQVCRVCNQSWMSDLETLSKDLVAPMVRAEHPWPLSTAEQIKLAIWGYKTGIMLALAHPEDQRWVPHDHYQQFYRERKPPNGVHIWVAALVPQHTDGSALRTGWSVSERLDFWRSDGTVDRHGYRLTFSVIALIFQIVFEPYGNKVGRPRETRDIWTRIRPVSKGQWPPRRWFTVDALAGLTGGEFIPAT